MVADRLGVGVANGDVVEGWDARVGDGKDVPWLVLFVVLGGLDLRARRVDLDDHVLVRELGRAGQGVGYPVVAGRVGAPFDAGVGGVGAGVEGAEGARLDAAGDDVELR